MSKVVYSKFPQSVIDTVFKLLKDGLTTAEVARKTSVGRRSICEWKQHIKNGDSVESGIDGSKKTSKIETGYGDNSGFVKGCAKSIDALIKKANVDLDIWEVSEARIKDNEWDVTMKMKKGSKESYETYAEKHTNYQFYIEIKLVRKTHIIAWDQFKRELIEDIKKHSPKVKTYKYPEIEDPHLLEVNIFDLHLGKLGWHEETGSSNYDSKIAAKRFMEGIVGLVKKAEGFPIERILFPAGNDFFNSDNSYPYPMTTKGTPQQDDLRWQQVFRNGRKLIMEGVDYLSTIAPVDILMIPSNHDFQKSFYLGEVLEVAYANNPNVSVNNSPNPRKYYQYGRNLIGLAHGRPQNEALNRLIMVMPQEAPKMWASTKFREWHLGDIHHKRVWKLKSEEDYQGINVRYMRSLAGDDAWHNQQAFKGAIRGCEAYIWAREWGMIANLNYNIII